ncbi:unnamed protein product [Litomosoides sigmodontis]|uniref:Uncharacterized protein n=1 Tax=Litomosoides sigmodontis TaxID=42156 RepID=A0A3P6UXR0_LITSI|nr:unnamed protein product [Litomosoides sigmodontis]
MLLDAFSTEMFMLNSLAQIKFSLVLCCLLMGQNEQVLVGLLERVVETRGDPVTINRSLSLCSVERMTKGII